MASIDTCGGPGGVDNRAFSVNFLPALHETERFDGARMSDWFLLAAEHWTTSSTCCVALLVCLLLFPMPCLALTCPALSCPDSAWSCPALSCPVSAWSCPALSCPRSNCADVLPCYQLYTDIAGVQHNRTLPLQIFLLRQTLFSFPIISNSISKRFKASAIVLYDYDNTYSCR